MTLSELLETSEEVQKLLCGTSGWERLDFLGKAALKGQVPKNGHRLVVRGEERSLAPALSD